MDDHRQQISSIISTTSLIAIVAIGSFVLFDKPFQSERPPSNISTSLLESRLWEDPFSAVFSLKQMEEPHLGENEEGTGFKNLYDNYTWNCAEFSEKFLTADNDHQQPLVLGVTLPGNRFTLSSETRRRIRYAVLSAINQTHVPLFSESISLLSLAQPLAEENSPNNIDCASSLKINAQRYLASIEIFKPYKPLAADISGPPESYINRDVIVLWLPEEELGTEILQNYTGLLRHIYPGSIIPQNSVLLGPISSNGLVDLQVERFNSNALTVVPDDIKQRIKEANLIPPYDNLKPDRLILETSLYTQLVISRSQQRILLDCLGGKPEGGEVAPFAPKDGVSRYSAKDAQKCLNDMGVYYYDDPDWSSTVISRLSRDQIIDPIEDNALREDLHELLRALQEQGFRNGFADELKRDLVSCLIFENYPDYLSRTAIASCFERLKIADSSTAWYDPVANAFPDASLARMIDSAPAPLRADIARLIARADDYLDSGLPADKYQPLIACFTAEPAISALTSANVSSCLRELAIRDSDSTWFDTIAGDWPNAELMAELANVVTELDPGVISLIWLVHGYLDNGLPADKLSPLLMCLAGGSDVQSLTSTDVAACLQGLDIMDSDSTWFDTMASNWQTTADLAGLDALPEALQPGVASLIKDAEKALDSALPQTERKKLIACLREEPQLTAMTSNLAAFCLSRLQLDEFAAEVSAISAQWPIEGMAEVPAQLRTDFSALIDAVNARIDSALLPVNRTNLIACLSEDQQLPALTREAAFSCLNELELDVVQKIADEIARSWPDQSSLIAIRSVPEALRANVDELITSADSYLDEGLAEEKRIALAACFSQDSEIASLTRNNVSSCLQALSIEDSDSIWYETLARNWPVTIDLPELGKLAPGIRPTVASLIEAANNFQETSLPQELNNNFVECFVDAYIPSYDVLSTCLKKVVSDWIARDWPTESLIAASARLPEHLRADAIEVARSANTYLDAGLPDASIVPLLGCLAADGNATALARENISLCLQALHINDSNSTWFDRVANEWPQASRLAALDNTTAALRADVDRLITLADNYFDPDMSDARRLQLVACFAPAEAVAALTRENVTACLQSLASDSDDPAVIEAIAADWPTANRLAELGDVPEMLRADVSRLIDSVHNYLDYGLPDAKRAELIACFAAGDQITALTSANVAPCLQALAIDNNSNTAWLDTLAGHWPDAGAQMELAMVRPALRADVTRLIDSIRNFLSADLTTVQYLELAECYAETTGITVLTRENVSSCLALHLPYAPHETIARKFRTSLTADQGLVLSPRATISRIPLIAEAGVGIDDAASPIIRTVTTDGVLLDAVFQELTHNRGLDAAKANVALVYENDGKFGRALESRLKCKADSIRLPICFDNVKSFGYLRGIDGLLAKDAGANTSSQGDADNISIEGLMQANENLENPYGQHQYDYLRRLADEVSQEKYDVIGVLGTDIFDKLLVLQALREKNPDAVFFTTDLDSYMAHASQVDWTQNLLVATSFGLNGLNGNGNYCHELAVEPGKSPGAVFAPPFRDNYQTSYFYSTCLALQVPELGKAGVRDLVNNELLNHEVLLYEAGRDGVHALPGATVASADESSSVFTITFWRRVFANMAWALLMLPAIGVTLFSLTQWLRHRAQLRNLLNNPATGSREIRAAEKLTSSVRICFWISVGTIVAMAALLIAEALLPGGEPLLIVQGISHWPATLLRIQILMLSVCFYFYATRTGMTNRRRIDQLLSAANQRDPGIDTAAADMPGSTGISGWMKDIDKDNRDDQRAGKHFRAIWRQHAAIAPSARYKHIAAKTLVIAALVFATFYLLTPQPHLIRDSYFIADLLFDKYFTYVKPFAFLVGLIAIAAIVIANDVIRLNRASIRALRKYDVTGEFCNLEAFGHSNYLDNTINEAIFKLEFIAKRTRDIEFCIMFPFVIVLLAIISRSTLFEGWHWSMPLIVLYCTISAYLLYCVIMLQVEASKTKKAALDFLALQQREYCSIDQPMRAVLEEELRVATRHVTGLDKGAFAAWYRHPLLLSMALPTSGTSGLLMLQQFF